MNPTQTHSETAQNAYFNLYVTGIGYLNRVREVAGKRGKPFLTAEISALYGAVDEVQYTRFDCRVSGKEAQAILRDLTHAIEADQKVLVGFRLGDLCLDTFTYQQGERQGQTGFSLKARLLTIAWVKIDGEPVALPAGSEERES